jgi:hypothetical protein
MIFILMDIRVNFPTMVILVIFIGLWMPHLKTFLGFNSLTHVGHLGLQFPLNDPKSITKDRVYGKYNLKLGR